MKPEPLFYIAREEGQKAGPYDLVQMAGLLRKKIITAETMTCLEGADHWMAFSWQPQFSVAREMSPNAVSMRIEEQEEANAGPLPMPSRETMVKLGGLALGIVMAFVGSFSLAWLDHDMGLVLCVVGVAMGAVAQCFILVRMMEEDMWTLLGIFFVPLYDIFYLICNIWTYFPWLCVKYIGTAIALGAIAGMGLRH